MTTRSSVRCLNWIDTLKSWVRRRLPRRYTHTWRPMNTSSSESHVIRDQIMVPTKKLVAGVLRLLDGKERESLSRLADVLPPEEVAQRISPGDWVHLTGVVTATPVSVTVAQFDAVLTVDANAIVRESHESYWCDSPFLQGRVFFRNGAFVPQGQCTLVYNQTSFKGVVFDGLFDGSGTFESNVYRIEGWWSLGELCSGRTFYKTNATEWELVYDGEFANGDFHGHGTAWVRGSRNYTGDWVEGKRNGRGVQYSRTKNTVLYAGNFKNDCWHGHGTRYDGEAIVYEGNWVDGKRHGHGRSQTFDGVFVNNKPCVSRAQLAADALLYGDEDDGDGPRCCVCLRTIPHGRLSWAWVPCGHRALCGECGAECVERNTSRCFVCNNDESWLCLIY